MVRRIIGRLFRHGIEYNKQYISELIVDNLAEYIEEVSANRCFEKYKNINYGKNVVLMGTGPSVERFIPIKDAVYIGVNRCALYKAVKFDYMFMQDYTAVKSYIDEMKKEEFKDTVKFYGVMPADYKMNDSEEEHTSIPNSIAMEHGASRYYVPMNWGFQERYPLDISNSVMAIAGSVIGPAFQFALYTNPKKIYVVGCDLTGGHFGGDKIPSSNEKDLLFWRNNKNFASVWYPEIEIVPVNPIGLKGLFESEIYSENGVYIEKRN